jgi:hypothetical protein
LMHAIIEKPNRDASLTHANRPIYTVCSRGTRFSALRTSRLPAVTSPEVEKITEINLKVFDENEQS